MARGAGTPPARRRGRRREAGTGRRLDIALWRRLSTGAIAVTAAVILYETLTPAGEGASAARECRFGAPCAAGHFALFALLGAAAAVRFAVSEAARRSPRRSLAMVVLALWLFAAAGELAQGAIDGRDSDLADWAVDMAGALTGLFLGGALLRGLLRLRGGG